VLLPIPPLVLLPVLPLVLPPVLPGRGAGVGVPGMVVVLEPPVVALPEAPAPALARASRRHVSRSVPSRPTHLLSAPTEAPPLALPLASAPVLPLVLGLAGLVVEPLVPMPVLPPAPTLPLVDAPPLTPLPDEAPVPELAPELCARVAVERARSAAAVAAVSVFNIMCVLLEIAKDCGPGDASPVPGMSLAPASPCGSRFSGRSV
jgi:hypothetical protein